MQGIFLLGMGGEISVFSHCVGTFFVYFGLILLSYTLNLYAASSKYAA
jgi:hypothetical protein